MIQTRDRISRAHLAQGPPDVAIGPNVAGFGLFAFHRTAEGLAPGHRAARAAPPAIRAASQGAAAGA